MKKRSFPDLYLSLIIIILIAIGIVAIYNTSMVYPEEKDIFSGHMKVLFVSILVCIILTFIRSIGMLLDKMVPWALGVALFFLVLVLIPGVALKSGGAGRWLNVFGMFTFQPSEFAKFITVLYLSNVLSKKGEKLSKIKNGLLPPLLVLLLIVILIAIEPDFGTAMLFAMVGFVMFIYAGIPIRYLVGAGAIVCILFIFLISYHPYMYKRLQDYKSKDAYQTEQAKDSFRSGGIAGNNFENIIEKPVHLPAAVTDFMLASFAQHYGFMGSSLIVILFFLFAARGFFLINKIEDMFLRYLGFGIIVFITFQAYLNILVAISVIPTTGMPLPFISYGRNTLLIIMIETGILLNITREVKE